MKFKSFQTILMIMLGVTSLSTFLLVFQTSEEWPQWSDDGEAAEADEGVRLRTLEESPLPSPPLSSPPLLKTLTLVGARNKSTSSKPTLYVLTTGVRHFQAPQAFTTTTVMGQEQTATVGPTFDEGYGPRQWPDGAKRVVDGHVTVWRKIAAECSGWCFVSEDDAIWPNGIPSELPSDGFVSFFREAVCGQAKGVYSENYDSVVKAVVPGHCMPYGAVAYAITGDFAKILLSKLPMSKPVDHFLWEQAVVQQQAYVSRRYVVQHKKGKSLRQHMATLPKNPEYVQGTGISDEYGTESAKHKKGRRQSVTLSTITEFGRECQKVYSGIGPDSLCNGIVPIDNPYMKSIGHGLNLSGSGRAFLSKPMRFSDFEFSCYSQTTEDGVLLSILESIGVTNRRAVEIAGGVGWENNLANLVINFGFETLFFDGDPGNVRCARNFFNHHPSTRHHPPVFADDFVSVENINSLIKSKGWSGPIDVFSLDIDGVDYWIWDAIEIIQPRVVVVEIQELWGPEERWTRPYNSNFHSDGIPSMGASLAAFDYLARKKGYRLVGCVKAGFNAFFVSESAANLDDIFGSGSYDRSGCFAHVDQHWRTVLDNRREKASKYSWVDPKTGKYLSNSNTVTDPTLQPLQTIPLVHHIGVKSSKTRPKIAVAIPTYNRAGYVQLCAAALSKTIPSNDVWIFDDHSTEYTAGELQKWFHTENVQQNTERFKADKQARHILEWFVGTDYDWLITLDSDLIVRPDWLELLRGMLSHTQGVMSLYHSGNPNHQTLHCDPNLCEMKSLGNAGVAWSKVLAKRMLVDMPQSDGFDWGWTEWLRQQKIPQYAAKDSLVLHVGMHGTWGADSKREKSVGFPMDKLSPDVRGRAEMFLKGM